MEDNLTTYKGWRIDDTAEWRLAVYITETGMSAYLKTQRTRLSLWQRFSRSNGSRMRRLSLRNIRDSGV